MKHEWVVVEETEVAGGHMLCPWCGSTATVTSDLDPETSSLLVACGCRRQWLAVLDGSPSRQAPGATGSFNP